MCDPVIDTKASHPDTVLTSMEYLQKHLNDMGMACVHISADLQLYMLGCQINGIQ